MGGGGAKRQQHSFKNGFGTVRHVAQLAVVGLCSGRAMAFTPSLRPPSLPRRSVPHLASRAAPIPSSATTASFSSSRLHSSHRGCDNYFGRVSRGGTPSMSLGRRGLLRSAVGTVFRSRRGGRRRNNASFDGASQSGGGGGSAAAAAALAAAAGVRAGEPMRAAAGASAGAGAGTAGGGAGGEGSMAGASWRRGEWSKSGGGGGGASGRSVLGRGPDAAYGGGGGSGLLSATRESVGSFGSTTDSTSVGDVEGKEGGAGTEGVAGDVVEALNGAVAAVDGVVAGEKSKKFRIGGDLAADFERRAKVYKSDWTDGLNRKSLPAIMFLYFASLLPAVAFGGIATQVTQGTLGVIEYVISCGVGGMVYAAFGGQPMTFIGPTGLTLAFMTSLYSFTSVAGLPFLPVYAWVGLWTSSFLITLSFIGASNLIEFATQFTDDVFNALLSVNFIYEAVRSLLRNFSPAIAGYSQAGALMSLNIAVATYVGCRKTSGALSSRLFNSGFREFLSDFGPLVVIVVMSGFCALPSYKGLLSFLDVPSTFMLCKGRAWLVPLLTVTPKVRVACALPAMLLTSLFFLDQNISSRVVNSPRHKMVKGPAYHQDMLVLGVITGVLSIVGLPWQCAATVQSLNHVRQMATFKTDSAAGGRSEEIESIFETRTTGFCVHALVLGSLALLPQLGKIPMAVVSGIFLYLGRKVMSGNGFLVRLKETLFDRELLPSDSDIKKVGFATASKYTAVQAAMLALLWTLKSFKRTALFFPSVIGLLIIVRLFALPKMFSKKDLSQLDAAVG